MLKFSNLLALFGALFLLVGCPAGDDDDDAGDDDAGDDDTGDDDTGIDCTDAVACDDSYDHETGFSDPATITHCESISGDLIFSELDGLTSIDLPCLTVVSGALGFWSNGDLLSVAGLANVTSVQILSIGGNDALPSLAGLSGITTVADDVYIEDNASLTSLEGLSALVSVGQDLDIVDNACLSQAEAEAFAAGLTVGDSVRVENNGANYPCD